MSETFTILTIGIALSMDAFSVSLGLGTGCLSNRKQLIISIMVGIMHFIMPLLGLFLGENIIEILHINAHILLTCILILIAFEMIRSTISCEEKEFKLNILGCFIFSFSVSFDAFSTGIGLISITNSIVLASIIFAISSFCFTYVGFIIGKYSKKKFGVIANIIGAILLIIIGSYHFFVK